MNVNILLVDDNQAKIRSVLKSLQEVDEVEYENIKVARDINEAKRYLSYSFFDLLILDMALPNTADQEPSALAGLALLEEITTRDVFKTPGHIVGLSAYKDQIDHAGPRMQQGLWSMIYFNSSEDGWSNALKSKTRHIIRAKQILEPNADYEVDVFWLCALDDPELMAVLDLPIDWHMSKETDKKVVHHSGTAKEGVTNVSICAAALPMMGPISTATYVSRIITEFRPKILVMTGIMAGNSKFTNFGDIVVANPTWDWGSGKHVNSEEGSAFFSAAPYQETLDPLVSEAVVRIRSDGDLLSCLQKQWRGQKPDTVLKILEGPVASGASVVADSGFFKKLIEQHRKLLGIDMEAHAFMYACRHCALPKPVPFVIKSVCDFADEAKSNDYQKYCSYVSAQTAFRTIMSVFGRSGSLE